VLYMWVLFLLACTCPQLLRRETQYDANHARRLANPNHARDPSELVSNV
jgi:hypothetical protein